MFALHIANLLLTRVSYGRRRGKRKFTLIKRIASGHALKKCFHFGTRPNETKQQTLSWIKYEI